MDSRIEDLIKTLRGSDWDEGEQAAQALAAIGMEAVDPLIGVLRDYHSWDQYDANSGPLTHAEQALTQIGTPAVETLIAALQEESWGVRVAVVTVLGEIGDVQAVQPLIDALRFEEMVGGETREALVKFGDVALRPLLYALKNNDDPLIRSGAASVLNEFDDPLVLPALIASLETETVAHVRQMVTFMLSEQPDARAVEPLISALGDSDPAVREEAARTLGEIGAAISSPRIAEALAGALGDLDWGTRQSAAEMLIRLKADRNGDAQRRLLSDLQHEDAEIRLGSAWSLVDVNDTRALEPLVQLLYHADQRIASHAAMALGKLGDQRAVIPLTATLNHADKKVRDAAQDALHRLDS